MRQTNYTEISPTHNEETEMEKEQRRRKIISRGTDRMALITGRINTLDQDPITKCSSFTVARHDSPPAQHVRSSSEPFAANQEPLFQFDNHHHGGVEGPDTTTKHDAIEELSKVNDSRSRTSVLQKFERKQAPTFSSDNACSPENQYTSLLSNSITAKEINFGIMSTEDIRAICSAVLGILVVLSHVSLAHNVAKPKSLIAYRPLYVILLTDVLIVAASLAPYAHLRKEEKEPKIEEDELNLGGALKYLELGLVLHQTIRAFFIDCSFYLVVVVCGLSLV